MKRITLVFGFLTLLCLMLATSQASNTSPKTKAVAGKGITKKPKAIKSTKEPSKLPKPKTKALNAQLVGKSNNPTVITTEVNNPREIDTGVINPIEIASEVNNPIVIATEVNNPTEKTTALIDSTNGEELGVSEQ